MGLFFRYLNLVCKMQYREYGQEYISEKDVTEISPVLYKGAKCMQCVKCKAKRSSQKKKKRKNGQTDKNSKVNQINLAQMLIRIHHYTIKVNPTCNTGINDSVSPLLPSPLRSISPAAPDGLVWWLLSRETWPGPSALVYLSGSLLPGQSGHFLVALVTQPQNKGGSR